MTPESTPFTAATNELYKQWEQAMTAWWDQVLESPSFLHQMGRGLEQSARLRGAYETGVDEQLERLHLPSRSDLTRVARIAALLEERLLQVEDRLLEIQDRLARSEAEAVRARIDAAESRLELRAALERIEAMAARLEVSGRRGGRKADGGGA